VLLTRTHIWHYFPHMIFFISAAALAIHTFLGRWFAYAALGAVGVLTCAAYAKQLPAYETSMQKQAEIAAFVRSNAPDWSDVEAVYLLSDQIYPISALSGEFRSTPFGRYLIGDPDFPVFAVVRDTPEVVDELSASVGDRRVRVYRLEDAGAVPIVLPQPGP
jgi:hypothetical protein